MTLAEYDVAIKTCRSCRELRALSWEIRRIAWTRTAWPEARRLADLADARCDRHCEKRGLIDGGRRPRWDSFYAGPTGIFHPAIS